jgi:hypothetical protein
MTIPQGLLGMWAIYFALLFSQALHWDAQGALMASHPYLWSDWSAHIGMIQRFATMPPHDWFAQHPYYSQGTLTYPALTNLLSSLWLRAGFSLEAALRVPSIGLAWGGLLGSFWVFRRLLGSSGVAVGGLSLFLFSSGPGIFTRILQADPLPFWESLRSGQFQIRDFLYDWGGLLQRDPSALPEYQWYASNVIEGILFPQRAFLLGWCLGVWGLGALLVTLEQVQDDCCRVVPVAPNLSSRTGLLSRVLFPVISGLSLGLLAWSHVHSLLALAPGVGMVLLFFMKDLIPEAKRFRPLFWALFWGAVPFCSLVLVNVLWILRGGIQNPHFQSVHWGWTVGTAGVNKGGGGGFFHWIWQWVWLWLRIWGVALPLTAAITLRWRYLNASERGPGAGLGQSNPAGKRPLHPAALPLLLGAWISFALGNVIYFQPMAWDNSKIFYWSYFFFSGALAVGLRSAWLGRGGVWSKALAGLLLVSLTCSGVGRVQRLLWTERNQAQMLSSEERILADQVREQTEPRAVFLTAPTHNHWAMLWAARPLLLGFTPWVWNYGFDYALTERDVRALYEDPTRDPAPLLQKYGIAYVVIGPSERSHFRHLLENRWKGKYPLAFESASGGIQVYRVNRGPLS